jgi:hypothetical protein
MNLRAQLRRAANRCINGLSHGPVVQAGRCQVCLDMKRLSDRNRYAWIKLQRAKRRQLQEAA